jgi:predicted transcriptional regulator
MTDHRPFTRRFRELIAGESQFDVAQKMGYTQSRVSHFARGEKPSRAFVEKLIEA